MLNKISFKNPYDFMQKKIPYMDHLTLITSSDYWYFDRHSHENSSEIMLVEEGTANYILNNKMYKVKTGDVIIINSGVVHFETSIPGHALKLWSCSLPDISFYGNGHKLIPDNMYPVFESGKYLPYLANRFNSLYEEGSNSELFSNEICTSLMGDIFHHIARIVYNSKREEMPETEQKLSEKIKQYIDENYHNKITLKTLADEFYVSTFYVNHIMKRELSISPIDYLISRRIQQAQHLLIATKLTVNKIAKNVGYENIHHFTSLFTKRIGCSPLVFRERYQNQALNI